MDLLVPAMIGGGAVYLYAQSAPPAKPPDALTAGGGTKVGSGGAPGRPLGTVIANPAVPIGHRYISKSSWRSFGIVGSNQSPEPLVQTGGNQFPIDQQVQGKLTEIEGYAKAAYENLDQAAKKKGAEILNEQLKLDPPLTGDEDWQKVATVAGSAIGGAVGGYFGGPIGAKLGALVGAYLGVKLEELISKNWDELKNWCEKEWGDAKKWISDEAQAVEDKAKEYGQDVVDFVGGIF